MQRGDLELLSNFLSVAQECSFTRAAAKLGVSQSFLSQKINALERHVGVKLLARNTRSVAPTEAGRLLIERISTHLDGISDGLATIGNLREKPSGTVRISAPSHAANTLVWPRLAKVAEAFPDIKIEINTNNNIVDIVKDGFDAGIRLGEQVAKDMIAVRISPAERHVCVATPCYFGKNGTPQFPDELLHHNCINLRYPTSGRFYAWNFAKGNHKINLRPQGNLIFTDLEHLLDATLRGLGVGLMFESLAAPHISSGRLTRVLEDWCLPVSGHFIYYPSRKLMTTAFRVVLDALREGLR